MKLLTLSILALCCSSALAETSSVYSTGITFAEFQNQGGRYETSSEFYGSTYKVNLDQFRDCSPKKVTVIAKDNENTMLRVDLESKDGWYEFGIGSETYTTNRVFLQIRCAQGIPVRNVWF